MFTRLTECLAATERISEVFSDASLLSALLAFETALSQAEARCGVIPQAAADAIVEAVRVSRYDAAKLATEAFRAGTPVIPLVEWLRSSVSPDAAPFVHRASTSQDAMDSALILLLKKCRGILAADHDRIMQVLPTLSDAHTGSIMMGRTLLQPATPVTFGFKVAGWYAGLKRSWARVDRSFDETLVVQFGGATGTLAALGDPAWEVSNALAEALELGCPEAAWHAHRDRLASLMAEIGVYVSALGKMALDIALLMQFEVGEAAEPGGAGRGGSSAMPHKRNPIACMLTISAARRTPGLVANMLSTSLQEHERGLGGWQAEWTTVEQIMKAAGTAVESMAEVATGLRVNPVRMQANLDATKGVVFAERVELTPEGCIRSAEAARKRLLGRERA